MQRREVFVVGGENLSGGMEQEVHLSYFSIPFK